MNTAIRFTTVVLAIAFASAGIAHATEKNSLYVEAFGGNAGNILSAPDGTNTAGASFDGQMNSIDLSHNNLFGVRMGYEISSHWRADLSYYSMDYDLNWSAFFPPSTAFPSGAITDFTADMDSEALLVSAYYSFNTESRFSPYVGLGFGVTRNKFYNAKESFLGAAFASLEPNTQQNFAYRAALGADYSLSDKWKLNMDISLINLGDATSGTARTLLNGSLEPIGRYEFDNIWRTSLTLGLRYSF